MWLKTIIELKTCDLIALLLETHKYRILNQYELKTKYITSILSVSVVSG
jgi:hypothetical protein